MLLRSRKLQLASLLMLAFAIRVGFCIYRDSLGVSPQVTFREYVIVGQNLLSLGTCTTPLVREGGDGLPSCIMPPAYSAIVAGTYALFGIETTASTLFLQLLNALATTATVLIVYDLARRIAGERAGIVGALVASLHPALFAYTDFIWDTSLFTFAAAFTVWVSYRLGDRNRTAKTYLLFGLGLGAVAMLNPSLTVTYPILVLWPILRSGSRRIPDLIRPVGWAICGWAIAITPWTIRNYVQFDEIVYVRGGFWIEMWLGACPEAEGEGAEIFRKHFPLSNPQLEEYVRTQGERKWIEDCKRQATAAIAQDPARWCKLIAQRTADYWTGTAFGHRTRGGSFLPQSKNRQLTMVFYILELGLITIFALASPTRRRGRYVGVLVGLLVSFSVIYCITHIQVRYRAPMEPIAAVLLGVLSARPSKKTLA